MGAIINEYYNKSYRPLAGVSCILDEFVPVMPKLKVTVPLRG